MKDIFNSILWVYFLLSIQYKLTNISEKEIEELKTALEDNGSEENNQLTVTTQSNSDDNSDSSSKHKKKKKKKEKKKKKKKDKSKEESIDYEDESSYRESIIGISKTCMASIDSPLW